MTLERQLRFWLGALAVFVLFLWLFKGVLLPFVTGLALAYLLDPFADRLEAWGWPRPVAALAILLGLLLAFVVGLVLVLPLLGQQLATLIDRLPSLVARFQDLATPYFGGELRSLLGGDVKSLEGGFQTALTQGAGWIAKLLQSLWNGGQAVVSILAILVISPVVASYLLVDWDRMIAKIDGWVPPRHRPSVRRIAGEMDAAVSGFVRGQVSVCLIMALYYGLGLALIGLEFGLLIGSMAGLLGIIPYVGFGSGLVVGLVVAVVQYWPDWHGIALVAAVFAGGQVLEGYVLTPNLVGRSVGLHPVWLLFALFAFGSLFGFVGMLVAVPAAAMVGVLARFAIEQYLASPLYREGLGGDADGGGTADG